MSNHTAHPAYTAAKSRQYWLFLQYPKCRVKNCQQPFLLFSPPPPLAPFPYSPPPPSIFSPPLHFTKQQQLQEQLSGRVLYMLTWKLISASNPNQQAVKKTIAPQVQQTFLSSTSLLSCCVIKDFIVSVGGGVTYLTDTIFSKYKSNMMHCFLKGLFLLDEKHSVQL